MCLHLMNIILEIQWRRMVMNKKEQFQLSQLNLVCFQEPLISVYIVIDWTLFVLFKVFVNNK